MANAAETLADIIAAVDESQLPDYLYLRSIAQQVLFEANSDSRNYSFADHQQRNRTEENFKIEVGGMFGWKRNVAAAVIVSLIVAQKGRINNCYGYREGPKILLPYLPSDTVVFAEEVIGMLREIKPKITGEYVSTSLSGLNKKRSRLLNTSDTELVAVLGLNGSGKTTAVKALAEFAQGLGLQVGTVKFPREDSSFMKVLNPVLRGENEVDRSALQMMFLADMFDFLAGIDPEIPVYLADRFAAFDGQVYSPDVTKLISLWSGEGVDIPLTPIIIDRHPLACYKAAENRPTKQRIFEKTPRQLAQQQVEFLRLLELPGASLINMDLYQNDPAVSVPYRIAVAAHRSGVWIRALIRTGEADDFLSAEKIVEGQLLKWQSQLPLAQNSANAAMKP